MDTSSATAVAAIPSINQIEIEIPESLRKFPGQQKINDPVVCGKKKGKYSKDCGCVELLSNSINGCEGNVKQIRLEYLASLESDVKSGRFDSNYGPDAKPAGSSHIQKFITPVPANPNPKATKQRQPYTYSITIQSSKLTFPNLCASTFKQIFCLQGHSLTKIRNDMMGKPTTRTRKEKDGNIKSVLSQLVPKHTKSIVRVANDGTVKQHTFIKKSFDAWIELLTILGDNEFLRLAKESGYYPTFYWKAQSTEPDSNSNDNNDEATKSLPSPLQPKVSFHTVHGYLEKVNRIDTIGKLKQVKGPDDGVTLIISGNGTYQRGYCFLTDNKIKECYGRCQQLKILRSIDPTLIEVSVNILTPITYFDDQHNNYYNMYGSVFDVDIEDKVASHYDNKEHGKKALKWFRAKLGTRRLKEIVFVGVGFKQNGAGFRIFLENVIKDNIKKQLPVGTTLEHANLDDMKLAKVTVVDIDLNAAKKNKSKLQGLFKAEIDIDFKAGMDAELYLKQLLLDRIDCSTTEYDNMIKNASYPTTTELNNAFAFQDPNNPGRWIQKEMPPVNDKMVDGIWPLIREHNHYGNATTTRQLRSGAKRITGDKSDAKKSKKSKKKE